jgi:hypothetical protein
VAVCAKARFALAGIAAAAAAPAAPSRTPRRVTPSDLASIVMGLPQGLNESPTFDQARVKRR